MLPQDAYLESQILTADPLELIRILYRAARDATRRAAAHLAGGRIADRAREISKAHAILTELTVALDHSRGGPLSRQLAELYDYMQRRLLEANQRQKPEPLAEVESLLVTLLSGWEQIGKPAAPVAAHAAPPPAAEESFAGYAGYPAGPAFLPPVPEYASQSWSF